MKWFLIGVVCLLPFLASAWQSGTETSANCLTNWTKGESHTYSIVHEKNDQLPDHTERTRFAYEARITVVDSTDNDYTVKWVIHIPERERIGRPALPDSLTYLEGMQYIYRISGSGVFIELINWEEVRDNYLKLMELSAQKDSGKMAAFNHAKNAYNSRQTVQAVLTREVQLFHLLYGYAYSTEELVTETQIGNPLGGNPIPAVQHVRCTDISPGQDRFTVIIDQHIDKAKAGPIPGPQNRSINIEMTDYSEYNFVRSSGWISSYIYTRKAIVGPRKLMEGYTIQLLP